MQRQSKFKQKQNHAKKTTKTRRKFTYKQQKKTTTKTNILPVKYSYNSLTQIFYK